MSLTTEEQQEFLERFKQAHFQFNKVLKELPSKQLRVELSVNNFDAVKDDDRQIIGVRIHSNLLVHSDDGVA